MNRRDFTRGSMLAMTAGFTSTQATATALQALKNRADAAWSQIMADYNAGMESPDQTALKAVFDEAISTPAEDARDIAIKVYIGTIEFDDLMNEEVLLSAAKDAKRLLSLPEFA
ncbi:hypothetical protein B0E33_01345 [Roseibium algicola]|uniref:Uncharacterized protein n=2 Tax=Roseibium algicola TaxID=2857014 RepID=A0ABN4WLF2_9HYPH|nr:hypothetical protein B0E33_01345 [Roseibium aggregatum]